MTVFPVIKKFVLIFLLILSGCQTLQLQTVTVREDEGRVFFYLQPFSREAERLRFSLSAFAALKDDGTEIPVPLSLSEFNSKEMARQRMERPLFSCRRPRKRSCSPSAWKKERRL